MNILHDWVSELSLQQQAVLLLGLRGCDGQEKWHGAKHVTHKIRGALLRSARTGQFLSVSNSETIPSFMSADYSESALHIVLEAWAVCEDELPVHFYAHTMHAAQVLMYKHPDHRVRNFFKAFYDHCVDFLHLEPESEETMDQRLNDFGRIVA